MLAVFLVAGAGVASAQGERFRGDWPETDFSRSAIDFSTVMSGGPGKDGIPAIMDPKFEPVNKVDDLSKTEPVIALEVNGDARAYPLRVLMWHEIANDTIGGVPVAVTYCPLCNTAIVFDRRHKGQTLTFGVSGLLRKSDMIMYDHQTESWWQQFTGEGIVGKFTNTRLDMLPARVMSFEKFAAAHPQSKVLVPNNPRSRSYGRNPYVGYISSRNPFMYRGDYTLPIPKMAHVVTVGKEAWPLKVLKEEKVIRHRDLVLKWEAGQNSALDTSSTGKGRDIGNITVQKPGLSGGKLQDVPYTVTFAFAFDAFHPDGVLHRAE